MSSSHSSGQYVCSTCFTCFDWSDPDRCPANNCLTHPKLSPEENMPAFHPTQPSKMNPPFHLYPDPRSAANQSLRIASEVTPLHVHRCITTLVVERKEGNGLTLIYVTLFNGTKILGFNYGSINPTEQDWALGEELAMRMVNDRIFDLEGYQLRNILTTPSRPMMNTSGCEAIRSRLDRLKVAEAENKKASGQIGKCVEGEKLCRVGWPVTPEQIIEIAKQASDIELNYVPASAEFLQRFADLVRNETLEEAAKHCEKYATEVSASGDASLYAQLHARGGTHCAAGVRSLKS